MSNSIGHNLFQQSLIRPASFKHGSNLNSSGIPASYLFQSASVSRGLQISRSPISSSFYGKNLRVRKSKLAVVNPRPAITIPRAILAMDPASQLLGKFNLDGNVELQVFVSSHTSASTVQVHIQITCTSDSLLLHWGGKHDRKENWVLPSRYPDGTKNYKSRALRSPFVKSGSSSYLKIEIDDPAIQALEFLILDEAHNKWFKNNGDNFHVKLPAREKLIIPNISVPEELVQVQAYLRWERNGKQMYTPEQEKKEYEAARIELLEEVAKGTSIEGLRARLTNKNEIKESSVSKTQSKIHAQAHRRWEKSTTSNERFQRNQRDLAQLVTKSATKKSAEEAVSVEPKPKALKAVELFAKEKEERVGGAVLNKKIFKLQDAELLVLVTKPADKMKVYVATDFKEPVTLHWALSRKGKEWLAPPPSVLPPGSVSLNEAAETQLKSISSTELSYQVQYFETEIEENFVGMPFVLFSNEKWIKNKGSDFYVELSGGPRPVQKDAGDGRGTAKVLLDTIAELESEAQKSFMHRFNIAADLMEDAKDAGELGFAGILVWMRFMATRQLIWNKNYNVKPREISKAQDRLTDLLQNTYTSHPQYRELLRMIMSTVGRGGEGDVGQRIRDEILVIQRNNDCKGGMMEEWHQKLHNNTSPDDVVICQALMDYIKSDLDISVYWKTLNENGITKERLLSYDRAIHSEPSFRRDQKDGLLRDLGNYMRSLKAVHSGADLESAIANCSPMPNPPPPQPPPPPDHHHHQTHHHSSSSSMFDLLSNFFDPLSSSRSPPPLTNPNSFLNLDMVWSKNLRSEPNCTDLGALIAPSSPTQQFFTNQPQSRATFPSAQIPQGPETAARGPSSASGSNDQTATTTSSGTNIIRNPKKRSRASRRAPTTVLTTDTTNFRAMVQEFTGIPAPPFTSSPFPRSRLDLFGTASTLRSTPHLESPTPPYLLRPFAQKFQPLPPFLSSSSSSSSSFSTSMVDAIASTTTTNINSSTSINYQLSSDLGLLKQQPQNLLNINMQNPILNLHSLLPKYPLPNSTILDTSKTQQASLDIPSNDSHLKMGVLEEFGLSHGHVSTNLTGLQNIVTSSPNTTLRRNESNNNNSNPANWGDGVGSNEGDQGLLMSINGNYSNSQQRVANGKVNYSASSSDFHGDKGPENVSAARSEGMVESWICSSD